jgi:type IV pilus assembly protein PilZ
VPDRDVVVLPVRFALGPRAIQATTRALEEGAAFIRSQSPPRAGLRAAVRLYFPQGSPEDLVATVEARQGPPGEEGFWVRFESVSEQARRKIERVLGRTSAPPPLRVAPARPAPVRPSKEEQRCTPRVAARLPVRFKSVAALRQEVTLNVSAGGMFIQTDDPPPLRVGVVVSLELPGERAPLEVHAQVVHRITPAEVRPGGMPAGAGVQFVEADDHFRETLDRYLSSHSD